MLKYIMYLMMMMPLIKLNNLHMLNMILLIYMISFMTYNTNNLNFNNLSFNISYDQISFTLILLTIWISLIMLMLMKNWFFFINIIFMMLILTLTFSSMNLFLFYFYFETSLIPIMIMILMWGPQPERINATMYMMLYTLFASFPLFITLFYIFNMKLSLSYLLLKNYEFNNYIILITMILAFLMKIPMFFLHLWLPKAHVEAPVFGSMILASVMLKLGSYGLIRMMIFLKISIMKYSFLMISINLIGGLLISLICYFQIDIKMLIAYSSIVHMSMLISSLMTINNWSIYGSILMMIGHGLCSSGLFFLINILYKQTKTRNLILNKSMINFLPNLSLWWFLLLSSNMAAPPSMNLLAEINLINSLIFFSKFNLILLMILSFLSAGYNLILFLNTQYKTMNMFFFVKKNNLKDYLILFLHWFPLNLMILKINIFFL